MTLELTYRLQIAPSVSNDFKLKYLLFSEFNFQDHNNYNSLENHKFSIIYASFRW